MTDWSTTTTMITTTVCIISLQNEKKNPENMWPDKKEF